MDNNFKLCVQYIKKSLSQHIELMLTKGIKIQSIQPKNNIIEELFINLEE